MLSEGVGHFPDSEELNLCLGISYMNLREYNKALACFLKFQGSQEAIDYIATCYRALGDLRKEEEFLEKAHRLEQGRPKR